MIRYALGLTALVLCCAVALRYLLLPAASNAMNVAHAGGLIDGAYYTNSISALNFNYDRGFRVFEIDFHKTADGHDVCSHDWDEFDGEAPDLETFLTWRKSKKNPPCLIEELVAWLAEHSDAEIVTDPKTEFERINIKLHGLFGERMIAQAYDAAQICSFRDAGIQRITLTLYRQPYDFAALMQQLANPCSQSGGLYAVAMDGQRLVRGHGLITKFMLGVPVYAHTTNSCFLSGLSNLLGADAIYSDSISGKEC